MQRDFQLAIGLSAGDYGALRRQAAAADRGGFAWVSVGDNPGNESEQYVSLSLLTQVVRTARIGTAVTTPNHRDPLVVASAFSSLESLAPGRVFMGVATGRARRRGSLRSLEDHVQTLRALWRGEEVEFCGERLALRWDARPVPVVVCVSGRRGLQLAGRIADEIIVESGVSTIVVDEAKSLIGKGAAEAERDPSTIPIWWYLKGALAGNNDEARRIALKALAVSAARVAGTDPAGRGVPDHLRGHMEEVAAWHRQHDENDDLAAVAALGSLPFVDYLEDRFGLVGDPQRWTERIDQLRSRGVDRVFCIPASNADNLIDSVVDRVLPGLGGQSR